MRSTIPTLALAFFSLGAQTAVSQETASAVASEPRRAEARDHYREGLGLLRAESFEAAEQQFRLATRLDPLFVLAHYELGETRMVLKRYPEAVEALERCIAVHKELVIQQQADRALGEKRLDEEIQELRDSLRALASPTTKATQPGNQTLRLESRLHELEQQRRRGTAPTDVPAEFSLALGSAYLRSGRVADAEQAYGEAIRVNPKMGEAHNNLAFVYFSSGRLDDAERELKAAEKSGFAVNPRFKDDLKKMQQQAAAKP